MFDVEKMLREAEERDRQRGISIPGKSAYGGGLSARPLTKPENTREKFLAMNSGANRVKQENLAIRQNSLNPEVKINPFQRIGSGIEAIGRTFVGAPAVLASTAAKNVSDSFNTLNNPEGAEAKRQADLAQARVTAALRMGGVPQNAARQPQPSEELKTLQSSAKDARIVNASTPADPNSFGARQLRAANQAAQRATEGSGPVGQFLGGTAISIGQNVATLPLAFVSPALPLAAMGTIAAGQKTHELSERGVGSGEAITRGMASGLIEAATEKVPLDNLFKIANTRAGKDTIKNILKQSGIEATEEAAAYVANYIADAAANDPEAHFSLQEMALSALGGAISGGLMGSGASLYNTLSNPSGQPQAVQVKQPSTEAQTTTPPLALPSPTDFYASPNGEIKTDLKRTVKAPKYAEANTGAFQPLALPAPKDFYAAPNGMIKTNLRPTLHAPSFNSEYFVESPFMRAQSQETNPVYSPVNAVQMIPRPEPVQKEPLRGARYRAVNSIYPNQEAAPVYSPVQPRQVLTPNPLQAAAPAQASKPKIEPIPLTSTKATPQAKSDVPGMNANQFINPVVRETAKEAGAIGRQLYRQMVSGQAPLERMAQVQTEINPDASTANELIQQVRNVSGTVEYVLEDALVDKMGNPMDVSWKEIVNMPEAELRQLDEYMQHKHNIDRQAQGKPVLEATAQESAAKVAQMDAANPNLAKKSQQIQEFWDKFMQEWVIKGNLLSPEQYQAMRRMYPNYIPTFRVDKDISDASHVASGRQIGTSKTIKRAKGGTSEVKAFEDNFAEQMRKFIKAERKNELFLNLADFARNSPKEAAPYAKIVPSDTNVDISDGYNAFVDDLDVKSLQEVKKGIYRVTAFENGRPVSIDVSQEVFDALNDLLNPKIGFGQQVGRVITSVPKSLITGTNPFFAVTNIVRDVQTGYVNSITDKRTFIGYLADLGKAANDMKNNTADWQLYRANGGARSGFFQNNKGFKESLKEPKGLAPRALKKTSDIFAWPGEKSEQVARFAEFQNGLQKYGRTSEGIKKAMQAAADVTVNFSRSGPTMKAVDSWVMYANAQMQGLDKMRRQIASHPVQTARRAAESVAIVSSILFFVNFKNPHFDDLDETVKDEYFLIPNLSDRDENGYARTFYRLPKSREYGVLLGGLLERSFEAADGKEDAFDGYMGSLAKSFAFANPATENALAPILYNLPQNKSWTGAAIVPQSMESLEPKYQYDYSTSEIAKALGNQLNRSPKKIDYVLDQYSGIVGDIALPLVTGTNRNLTDRFKAVANPISRKFIADPLYSSAPVGKLYDAIDEAKSVADTKYFVEDVPKAMVTPEKKRHWFLNKIADDISELRKQERELLAGKGKESEVRAIRQQINDLARNAKKRSEAFEEAYRAVHNTLTPIEQTPEFQKLTLEDKGKVWDDLDTYATAMAYDGNDAPKWVSEANSALDKGVPIAEYFMFRPMALNTKSDKDSFGKAISDSRKYKIIDYLNKRKLSPIQRNYLYGLEYKE